MESILWELYEQRCTRPKTEKPTENPKEPSLLKENIDTFGSTINRHHRLLNFAMTCIAISLIYKSAGKRSANASQIMLSTILAIVFPSLILVFSSSVYMFEKQQRVEYSYASDGQYNTQSGVQSLSIDSPLTVIDLTNHNGRGAWPFSA